MTPSAVLFSGGLDSAVLLALECRDHAPVHPIHIRAGLAWEDAEAIAIRSLLAAEPYASRVTPLSTLTVDMREIYPPTHWAVVGTPPAFDTPDEDVYLEGRNVILIAKASVLCARLGVGRLALGPLAGNPFPDARPEFFATMAQALSIGLDRPFEIATPLAHLHKEQVVTLGLDLNVPLELTLSCMRRGTEPFSTDRGILGTEVAGSSDPATSVPKIPRSVEKGSVPLRVPLHCGICSKCRERRDAFIAAGVEDRTAYAVAPAR